MNIHHKVVFADEHSRGGGARGTLMVNLWPLEVMTVTGRRRAKEGRCDAMLRIPRFAFLVGKTVICGYSDTFLTILKCYIT